MSVVIKNSIFLRLLIGPEITWSVPRPHGPPSFLPIPHSSITSPPAPNKGDKEDKGEKRRQTQMFFTVFKTFFSQFFTVSHIFPLFFFTIFTICHRFFTAYNSFHCCSLIVTAQPSLHGLVWYQYYYLHVLRYLVSPAYSICFGWIIGAINIRVDEFVVQIKP